MSNHHLALVRAMDVIKGPARAVLNVLADRADETGAAWPSWKTLQRESGFSRSAIHVALRSLKDAGLVSWSQRRSGDGNLTSNIYLLKLPSPQCGQGGPRDGLGVVPGVDGGSPGGGRRSIIETSGRSTNEASLFEKGFSPRAEEDGLFDYWNTTKELPKIKAISPERKQKLKARLKEPFFRENWKDAIDKAATSSFLTGMNERRWKADIDWFLKPGSIAKIIEGKYDGPPPGITPKPATASINTGKRQAPTTTI